jgi:oxygen-independent coproporphyrinogen-3 oxidase
LCLELFFVAGIYLHIPFCAQACHYCDFHFSTNLQDRHQLIDCLGGEIVLQKEYFDRRDSVNTIYFGGGTPSLLSSHELTYLLDVVRSNFIVSPDAEITLEANPDDLSADKLSELLTSGINRLSIGIQSFNNKVLRFLNRKHDAETAFRCVREARAAGFANISIDLIFAIPGESHHDWIANLRHALEIDPEHISAYSLTIEERTAFGRWAAQGKLRPVEDDSAAQQMEILMEALERAGYEHYEISNFSKPGFHSRHNSNYWKQEKYLGIGPSAHSFNGMTRQHNHRNNQGYVRSIKEGKVPYELEKLTVNDQVNDYILTSLRTMWGCDTKKLWREFEIDLLTLHAGYIERLISEKLATLQAATLILTRKGKLLADRISSDLFL